MVETVDKMKLHLAKDGIFPITKDKEGKLLKELPASGLHVPGTIQGEGKLNGIPSLFVRLAGCNLHCTWRTLSGGICECDTAYAAYHVKDGFTLDTEEIVQIIRHNRGNINHIVVTGGEPFLQAEIVAELCRQLKSVAPFHITVETNATIYDEACARELDFFSMSPKLSGSVPSPPHAEQHDRIRLNREAIQSFITHAREHGKDFQLKFVYSGESDITEIKQLLSRLQDWKQEDILLMPMGATPKELQLTIPKTLEHCIQNGWRYCDRLHIALFGNKQGV